VTNFGANDVVEFMGTRTRGSPSRPGACSEVGSVEADFMVYLEKTSCRRGGPYVVRCLVHLYFFVGSPHSHSAP